MILPLQPSGAWPDPSHDNTLPASPVGCQSVLPPGTLFFPGDPGRGPDCDDASVAAQLDEIQLVSTKDDACVSPITYLEARRFTTFDPRARRALDRQLQHVDSRILKLRPQFAPPR